MPLESIIQPCEVCGVLTSSKCAACDSAGILLFFCSRDHQKLVWPAHKLVCGQGRALPFATKPLERSELDIAKKRLDEVALPFQPGAKSLRKKLVGFGPIAHAETVLVDLEGDVYDKRKLEHKPLMAALVRSAVSHHLAFAGPGIPFSVHFSHLNGDDVKSFDELAAAQFTADVVTCATEWLFYRQVMSRSYTDEPLFSLLQHKTFLISRLSQLSVHPLAPPGVRELCDGARKRFLEWVRAGMGTGRDDFARALEPFQMLHVQLEAARRP